VATRTYKESVPFPPEAPLTRLSEIEDVLKDHGPISWRIEIEEAEGKTVFNSIDEAMAEMPDRESPSFRWMWVSVTAKDIEASMLLFSLSRESSLDFAGTSQTVVLGCAAAWRRRLERPAQRFQPIENASRKGLARASASPEADVSPRFLSPESPQLPQGNAAYEPSRLRRALNNVWVVGAIVGLVIAILIAVLILLNR
jgi:hypothetical protein